ncbi:glutathione S-transferase omega-1-like [Apostichopus japonicus]|uniref:glutathione S-transferase omega-1-like n=1 Tax=Stichopus japonicus TaxID=307972 RepID=UPI003AB2949F
MAPSPPHLNSGDALPPLKPGVIRLYSMKFCPFAERARLVLNAKNIEHEVINVNLWEKPTWFADKNPNQQVPIVEHDGKIVYESLIVSAYLEELYPDKHPLVPKDPYSRAKDAMLIEFHGGKVIPNFFGAKDGVNEEKVEALKGDLAKLDQDLKERGTDFFYGSQPGYLDYMIWPIFARVPSHGCFGAGQGIPKSLKVLAPWVERMMKDKAVQSTIHPDSAYTEFNKYYRKDATIFDRVETPN